MAKSLRSKWKRKCRAVKRERYAVKELARLKKTLEIDGNMPKEVEMTDISEIATVVDAKKVKEEIQSKTADADSTNANEQMEVEGVRIYNKKTKRDQYGNYPVWMNRRRIFKDKCKKGRAKSQKATRKSNKRITRRQKKIMKQQD